MKTIQFDTETGAYIRGPIDCPARIRFAGGSVSNFDKLPAETRAQYGYVSDLRYVALPEGAVLRNATWVRDGDTAIQQGAIITAEQLQAEADAAAAEELAALIEAHAPTVGALAMSLAEFGLAMPIDPADATAAMYMAVKANPALTADSQMAMLCYGELERAGVTNDQIVAIAQAITGG